MVYVARPKKPADAYANTYRCLVIPKKTSPPPASRIDSVTWRARVSMCRYIVYISVRVYVSAYECVRCSFIPCCNIFDFVAVTVKVTKSTIKCNRYNWLSVGFVVALKYE